MAIAYLAPSDLQPHYGNGICRCPIAIMAVVDHLGPGGKLERLNFSSVSISLNADYSEFECRPTLLD